MAVLAGREQRTERAARLFGAAEAFCDTLGAQPPAIDPREYERSISESRVALGEAMFAAAWTQGRALSLDQAIEYALEPDGMAGAEPLAGAAATAPPQSAP